jgi:16S rRNA (adenine1518-N6/adenine1519-N6)-dimethyltransferase
VIGVEIDRRLVRELQERHGDHPRLQIVHDDVIRADWGAVTGGRPFVLAGNLPYNITSALLFKALDVAREQPGLVRRIVVLLQHEVAQRLVAEPGSSEYSVLTVFLRMFGEPELLRVVPRGAFRPPPKVDAGLLRVELGERIRYPVPHWPTLRALVKGTFAKRRKMLRNTIPSIPGLAPMEGVEFDWTRRPQTLSAEEFAWLAAQLTPKAKRKDGHDG